MIKTANMNNKEMIIWIKVFKIRLKKKKRMSCKEEAYAKKLTIKIEKKHRSKYRMPIMRKSKSRNRESF